jgi:acetyl-CoA carboxylase biotin carboxyl carrier protein
LSKRKINDNKRTVDSRDATRRASASSPMSVDLLEQLTRLMRDNDLNTVDVRDGDKRIILKRGAVVVAPNMNSGFAYAPAAQSVGNPGPAPGATSGASSSGASSSGGTNESDASLVAIKSPMVGTFYASSSPDAKPFVQVGSQVDEETDVCIIEAMKVFNNIKAECRGTISKVLVENGATVEFGQTLFLVRP